ncbi:MAG: hypothetical protein ACRCUY_00855 [Thermoguttaceae bacterium]
MTTRTILFTFGIAACILFVATNNAAAQHGSQHGSGYFSGPNFSVGRGPSGSFINIQFGNGYGGGQHGECRPHPVVVPVMPACWGPYYPRPSYHPRPYYGGGHHH